MRMLPVDVHAHIDAAISAADLGGLNAHIFAMTRSMAEFESVASRRDPRVVWGLGLHPGLVRNQRAYSKERFRELVQLTPLVGEVGLDAKSRVSFDLQLENFRSILTLLQECPRIVSVHSYEATTEIIRELTRRPVKGVILHWWLGSAAMTEEAVKLGCYFSVPPAMSREADMLRQIPRSRLLFETDHPSGDRFGPRPRRPGNTTEVERRVGALHDLSRDEMRALTWRNLARVAQETGTASMFGSTWNAPMERASRPTGGSAHGPR